MHTLIELCFFSRAPYHHLRSNLYDFDFPHLLRMKGKFETYTESNLKGPAGIPEIHPWKFATLCFTTLG